MHRSFVSFTLAAFLSCASAAGAGRLCAKSTQFSNRFASLFCFCPASFLLFKTHSLTARHSSIARGLARPARPPFLNIPLGARPWRWQTGGDGAAEVALLFGTLLLRAKSALGGQSQASNMAKFTAMTQKRAGLGGSRTHGARRSTVATASPLYPFPSAVRRAIACIAT